MLKILVSYRYRGFMGTSGNQSFDTPDDARKFVADNKAQWQSHSVFTFVSGQAVAELIPAQL